MEESSLWLGLKYPSTLMSTWGKSWRTQSSIQVNSTVETLYFRDNTRIIDYVLVYKDGQDVQTRHRRKLFEQRLIEEGLELEKEDKSQSQDGLTYFVKVHCSWEILVRYAEILKIKKPIKGYVVIKGGQVWEDDSNAAKSDIFSWLGFKNPFMYNEDLIPPEPAFFSTGFNVHRTEQ
ncbi:Anoctamin dimerization domain [Trinorchestia longiramus]|nr:Anoctamin dimerization domain [Trinorchestia longiramus]